MVASFSLQQQADDDVADGNNNNGNNNNNNERKNSWNWSVIFAEQSHEAARARCMLWWRVLHDRWQSPMLRRRWQPEGSGWCSVCAAARPDAMLALGTTAHVFIECDEAQRVWHWLRDVWRALTDGGELRCDARAILSGFALPSVRAWRPLRRLRLALFVECFGAIADAQERAGRSERVVDEEASSRSAAFRVAPLVLARLAVRERARQEFEDARVNGEQAMRNFRTSWAQRQVLCSVSKDFKLQLQEC